MNGGPSPRESPAPRKNTTDAHKKPPHRRPTRVGLLIRLVSKFLTETLVCAKDKAITPIRLTPIATIAQIVGLSPRRIRPSIAICTTSVFESVVPTAKLRN